jgi:hypothetical protein
MNHEYLSLIEYQNDIVRRPDGVYESGNWDVASSRIPSLIGKTILFHRNQSAPSHFGGRIVDAYRIESSHGVFLFHPLPE